MTLNTALLIRKEIIIMTNQNEYEIIPHNNSNFHIFIVNLFYRTPHIHKDFEISLILDGSLTMVTACGETVLEKNDIFIINPYVSHEIRAKDAALIISLQVPASFFAHYFPQIDDIEFDVNAFYARQDTTVCHQVYSLLFELAAAHFQNEEFAPLRCALLINQLFLCLLSTRRYHLISRKEKAAYLARSTRMKRIMQYIDAHYKEKLLLSDIAKQEQLDLYYLSHLFKEVFGTSFQNYITKLRCEHARQLLLLTDCSLLDISLSCGFSDCKYFNKGFFAQYGCTPRQYRQNFRNAHLKQQQQSMLSTQEFLSEQAALALLERYRQT